MFLARSYSFRSVQLASVRYHYTRSALRRLKKAELVALAVDRQLATSGTKSDLIDRLLVPEKQDTTTPESAAAHSMASSSSPAIIQLNFSAPTKATEPSTAPMASSEAADTPSPSTNSSKSTAPAVTNTSPATPKKPDDDDDNDIDFDAQWVEAFDLKVHNRGSTSNSNSSSSSNGRRSGGDAIANLRRQRQRLQVQHERVSPSNNAAVMHEENTPPTMTPSIIAPPHRPTDHHNITKHVDDPEINADWVKAFDRRVLRPSSSYTDRVKRPNRTIPASATLNTTPEPTTVSNSQGPSSDSVSTRDKIINWSLGISMSYWYIMGEEGIRSLLS
ncbi:hypothetical protein BC940DRAFT_308570 [Gongronella butleri]|nr:hypothetical protein BC940DRAFT_308570 [Gongronella butleri]